MQTRKLCLSILVLSVISVLHAQTIIVDNSDAGFAVSDAPSWSSGSATAGHYGADYRFAFTVAGDSTTTASWTPSISTAGYYYVSTQYPQGSNRAIDAPFTISGDAGTTTIRINQQTSGGSWVYLAQMHFATGSSGAIYLGNNAGSTVVLADAVQLVYAGLIPGPEPASATTGTGTTSGPEYRGMWVSRFEWPQSTQVATQNSINTIMSNVRGANFNSVFFQIRGAMETSYPSPNEPWSSQFNYTNPGYDPVLYAVDSAHTNGLEFHAYINTHTIFQASTTSGPPPPHTTPEHPFWLHGDAATPGHDDWCYVDSTGTTQPLGAGEDRYDWASPGVPALQAWTRQQILHVANTYNVDGVHFDRIRVAGDGSHDPISVARQASVITNPAGLSFQNWQRDQITRFLNDVYGAIAEINYTRSPSKRHIKVSSAPFPYPPSQANVNQDISAWTKIGAQDFFVPQVYTGTLSTFQTRLAANFPNLNGRYVVAGMNRNNAGSMPTLFNEVTEARNQQTSGSTVFSYTAFAAGELASYTSNVYSSFVPTPDMDWITTPTDCIIVGNVKDVQGNPIVDAQLTRADGNGYVWLSGYDGFYSMLKVPIGQPLQLTITKAGLRPITIPVTARAAGTVTRFDVTLSDSAGQIELDQAAYAPGDFATIHVADSDLIGLGTIDVLVASNTEQPGEIVTLDEVSDTGDFEGFIDLETGSPADDGVLQVNDGDTITATYVDEDDGTGQSQNRTATATVDGSAPVISNVAVTVNGTAATITFDTNESTFGEIEFGTACNDFTDLSTEDTASTHHSIILSNLNPFTTYYFQVNAYDQANNAATDNNNGDCYTFATTEQLVIDNFTEEFDVSNPFDLSFRSLTFTPDASSNFYSACAESAGSFPTDPAGGTALPGADDSSSQVFLTGGKTVSIYGSSFSSVYVGSNGYVTFGSPDTEYDQSIDWHFSFPRVAALFRDLDSRTNGAMSYKQLADRLAITYIDVPSWGTTDKNSFQIELFFNGTIRVTWLGIGSTDGIAGLSAGNDTPLDFAMSDLSVIGSCSTLNVSPIDAFRSEGAAGGPFSPTCASYGITNDSALAFDFEVTATQSWLTPDVLSGTLQPGETTTITICLGPSASSLPLGDNAANLVFNDLTNARSTIRAAVLSILSPPEQTSDPDPVDGDIDVDVNTFMSWSGGAGAENFDFYFGTTNPPAFAQTVAADTTDLNMGTLAFGTTYFWRVDARNAAGTTTGDVWSFTTQGPPDIDVTPTEIVINADPGGSASTTFDVANVAPGINGTLTFLASANDSNGGVFQVDDVGTYTNFTTGFNYYGNAFQATQSTRITKIQQYLYVPATTNLNFVVGEATTAAGPYTVIFSQTGSQTATFDFCSSGLINVPITADRFYVVAVGWAGSGNYAFYSADQPVTVAFGSQFSGFTSSSFPLGNVSSSFPFATDANTYYQRITTNSSWFSIDQPASRVNAGASTTCQFNANAAGLPIGIYTGNVLIASNDPDEPVVTLPVTFNVADITPPAIPPAPDMLSGSDTGISNSDNLTALPLPDFQGSAEADSLVTVFLDGNQIGQVSADGEGAWSFTPDSNFSDGQHSLTVTATDASQNTSGLSAALTFVIDTVPPSPPSTPLLTMATDTGISAFDGVTTVSQPTFTGSAEANSQVLLKLQSVIMGSTTADEFGQWTIIPTVALLDSSYQFTAVAVDTAGNTSAPSPGSAVVIDTASPTVGITRFGTPVSTIHLHFSETVFNFSIGSLELLRDTIAVSLAGANLTGGGQDYDLSGLASVTGIGGSFVFRVSGAIDAAGNTLPLTSSSWTGSSFADLKLSMVVTPGSAANIGQSITYVITVQNDGPADAANVVLLDNLTSNSLVNSVSISQGAYVVSSQQVQVNLGPMAANSSTLITMTVVGTEIGALVSNLSAGPTDTDPDTSNNSASNTVQIALGSGPDLLGTGMLLSSQCHPARNGLTCTQKLRLFLQNRGNVDSGKSSIRYYLSNDRLLDSADVILTSKKLNGIKAGYLSSKARTVKLGLSGNPQGQFIIVKLDADNLVAEGSEFNNEIVIGPLP